MREDSAARAAIAADYADLEVSPMLRDAAAYGRRPDVIAAARSDAGRAERGQLASIYAAYRPYVWRCVRRMGIVPEHVEAVVYDVFRVVSERLHAFDGRTSLKTWIYTITFAVAAEDRRRYPRDARPTHELAGRLQTLLAGLDLQQRAVFVLIELEHMSGPETAQILGIKLNTVYSRLRLARRRIERELEATAGVSPLAAPPA